MAHYFRWKKGKRDEDVFYSEKPRSRSLDPRSLELSGIRLVAQYHQQQQQHHHQQQPQQQHSAHVQVSHSTSCAHTAAVSTSVHYFNRIKILIGTTLLFQPSITNLLFMARYEHVHNLSVVLYVFILLAHWFINILSRLFFICRIYSFFL